MRKLLALLLLLPSLAFADYVTTVAADSPTNFWYLDETSGTTATDHGSRGNNGTYKNTPTLNQSCQVAGHGCPLFNGTTQDVETAAPLGNPSANDISVECWVNFASIAAGNSNVISSIQNDGTSCGGGLLFVWVMRGPRTSPPNFLWNVANTAGCGNYMSVSGTTNLTTGVWYQTVGTYKHTATQTTTIYLNGAQEAQNTTTSGSPANYEKAASIAARGDPATSGAVIDQFLNGNVQMCSTFSSELTSTRVLAHYNAGIAPATSGGLNAYSVKRPELPMFRNPDYWERFVFQGYNTGLFASSVAWPWMVGFFAPFSIVPNGIAR